jgi:hypothetical protein
MIVCTLILEHLHLELAPECCEGRCEGHELPTDVQRTLFRLASADAESAPASELPARIARFLHDHKDDAGTR